MESTSYIIMNMMRANSGGLNKAICTRVNMFIEQGRNVEILTGTHNTDVDAVRKELRDAKRLDERVTYRNIYEDLAGDKTESTERMIGYVDNRPFIAHPIEEPGFALVDADQPNSYRYFKDGLYRMYKRYDANKLVFIDYFDENRHRIKKEVYDDKGYLKRTEYMDLKTNTPNTICFYNKNGNVFLTKWVSPANRETTTLTVLFDDDGKCVKVFKTEDLMKKYWIEEIVMKDDKNPIVFSDIRGLDPLFFSLEKEGLRKIAIMHNNHFDRPYTKGSDIVKTQLNVFNNAEKLHAIVTLTEQQRQDIIDQFGEKTRYVTISHPAPVINYDESKREDFTIISLSRYHANKKLDQLINAFKSVIQEIPQAKLEVWGMGSEEENLKNLVKELKLENNVFIKGFTSDPISIFERATASVLTSINEGFGLVITESMAAGAPVISYDILYGPRDIITDGVDGIIVERENIDELSSAMIDVLKNPEKRKQMSAEARKISENFSFDKFTNLWMELLDSCK